MAKMVGQPVTLQWMGLGDSVWMDLPVTSVTLNESKPKRQGPGLRRPEPTRVFGTKMHERIYATLYTADSKPKQDTTDVSGTGYANAKTVSWGTLFGHGQSTTPDQGEEVGKVFTDDAFVCGTAKHESLMQGIRSGFIKPQLETLQDYSARDAELTALLFQKLQKPWEKKQRQTPEQMGFAIGDEVEHGQEDIRAAFPKGAIRSFHQDPDTGKWLAAVTWIEGRVTLRHYLTSLTKVEQPKVYRQAVIIETDTPIQMDFGPLGTVLGRQVVRITQPKEMKS